MLNVVTNFQFGTLAVICTEKKLVTKKTKGTNAAGHLNLPKSKEYLQLTVRTYMLLRVTI